MVLIGRVAALEEPRAAVDALVAPGFTSPGLQLVRMPFGPLDAGRFLPRAETHRVALPDREAVDAPDAVNVSTGRFGIITRNTPAQIIQTAGAGPCVIVVLHDRASGVAALAHFHPRQDPQQSVAAMVAAARRAGLDPARTTLHVAGGLDAAPELPERVLAALAPYGFARGERDLLGARVRALQFHLADGRLERYREDANDQPPSPNDGPVAIIQRHPRAWR